MTQASPLIGRSRRFVSVWVVPPILFFWEVSPWRLPLRPMPWTSLEATVVWALLGVVAVHLLVYLRALRKLPTRAYAGALLVLASGLAYAMLYAKSLTLPFFNGIVAVSYSLLVTTDVGGHRVLAGIGACIAGIVAMNTTGASRVAAFLACACAVAWLVLRSAPRPDGRAADAPERSN